MPQNLHMPAFAVALGLSALALHTAVHAADDAQFASQTSFTSAPGFELGVSKDGKAFTITFSALEAATGNSVAAAKNAKIAKKFTQDAPISSKGFSFVLPLKKDAYVNRPLYVTGYALTTAEAAGTLLLTINGRSTLVPIKPNSDNSFLEEVKFEAPMASELRMTAFVIVERPSNSAEAAAYLNVAAIDTDLAGAKERLGRIK